MKTLSILGSTGSIGTQALDIVRSSPKDFKVIALSCNNNIDILKKQADEFKPEIVAVYDKERAAEIKDIEVVTGMAGLKKIAKLDNAEIVLNALVGSIGVEPTLEAIRNKKTLALANKETLVTAGSIVMRESKKNSVDILPIDSEHSAIWQCLNGEDINSVSRLLITCSGGAFRNRSSEELAALKAADALKHPTWDMGAKITIDSATLMNKGFEVIEAHHLYDIPYGQIEVLIHPESIIHSLVEFKDNSVIAQLGIPSMKIPIQYALTYPKREKNETTQRLDLLKIKQLNFQDPDLDKFPCLKYAYEAGKVGGSLCAVMNAANEIAVKYFLKDKISFLDIPLLIKEAMDDHKLIKQPNLDEIIEVDRKVKKQTEDKLRND
ncbi:MAG: 1-deoxy-D-xylulose-5-phosphate reductoisomerase [Nanoarchaeota archaeon]